MKHTDTGFSSTTFEMPLDGLEEANRQRSEQALKLARAVIAEADGPFIDENLFWSPLYALSPQETRRLEAREQVEGIVGKFRFSGEPVLIRSANELEGVLHIGQLASFKKGVFRPYQFQLHDKGRHVPWDADRMAVDGTLELAINELETPMIGSRHRGDSFGFTDEVQAIEVARIKTIYADRGVFPVVEEVGEAYVGTPSIIEAAGKLGGAAIMLTENYFLAKSEQEKQKQLRRVS